MSETALVPSQVTALKPAERIDALKARYEKFEQKDLAIVEGMNRFAEVPSVAEPDARAKYVEALQAPNDEAAKALGFKTKRALRVAMYGTLSKKDWPASMQAAHERVMARIRKQEGGKGKTVFNLNMVTIPAPRKPTDEDRIITVEPNK